MNVHKNLFAPLASDLLTKLAERFFSEFHGEHILLNLKKKVIAKN